MNLKKAALLAEVVGGLAVVLTLIALILEVRENTNIVRASAYNQNIDSLNAWRMNISQSKELSRLYQQYVTGQTSEWTDDEEFRLWLVINQVWGVYEKAYYASQYGILGPQEWRRFERQMCASESQIVGLNSAQRRAMTRFFWTEEFAKFVKATCSDSYPSEIYDMLDNSSSHDVSE